MNKNNVFRMNSKAAGIYLPSARGGGGAGGGGFEMAAGWEVRPGGMLVQRRSSDSNQTCVTIPNIKVKVKYGRSYQEISINSQASFGELKKMLAGPTGLHPQDQKLIYKDKERDSKVFLHVAGVEDGSKIVFLEDELSKERQCIESVKTVKMEKASKEIAAIRLEIDKLAKQVASTEHEINCGKKVVETVLLNLIELLMTQLIKLDGISADGDVKLQRRMQVKRVQKYIETLDILKIRNSSLANTGVNMPLHQQKNIFQGKMPGSFQNQQEQKNQGNDRTPGPLKNFQGQGQKNQGNWRIPGPVQKVIQGKIPGSFQNHHEQRNLGNERNTGPVVVTTKWETF